MTMTTNYTRVSLLKIIHTIFNSVTGFLVLKIEPE